MVRDSKGEPELVGHETSSQKAKDKAEATKPKSARTINEDIPESQLRRLQLLRVWLMFLVFCFIFEMTALEVPSLPFIDGPTKSYIGTMALLTLAEIFLIYYSYQKDIHAIYFVSLLM